MLERPKSVIRPECDAGACRFLAGNSRTVTYIFAMKEILQNTLPFDPTRPRPLPGIAPMPIEDWLMFDDAFAAQMAERERLLDTARDAVLALDVSGQAAAQELLDLVLEQAYPTQSDQTVMRPDGVCVTINRDDPMDTLGRLVQQDFCILQKQGDEHVLVGAVLCFPASWMLSEKFMRPLTDIHVPVDSYDDAIAKRVQRLFDGVQPDRPLWRFNALWYSDPTLHQPRKSSEKRTPQDPATAPYFRTERQSVLRLPKTRAVIFGVHTSVLTRARYEGLST